MTKSKIFGLAFLIASISTALLCMAIGLPLTFVPVSYGVFDFLVFSLLIAVLCAGLVYLNLGFLFWLRAILKPNLSHRAYYIAGTLIALQVVTLLTGYLESAFFSLDPGDIFYYYKGVGNSRVYILTGNITAIVVAELYAIAQKKKEEDSKGRFDFEG